jgi:mono/diheme cytochrome c family protein
MDVMLSHRAALAVVALSLSVSGLPAAAAPDGEKLFAKSCAPCHGKDGQPNALFAKQGVRVFKDADWQKSRTDAQLEQVIREGKKGTMMASFEKQLSAAEIKALVAFIRKLGAPKK